MEALYIKHILLAHIRLRLMAFAFTSKEIYEAILQALDASRKMWVVIIAYRATLEDERSYVSLLAHPRVYVAVSDVFFHAKVSAPARFLGKLTSELTVLTQDILVDDTYYITGSVNLSHNGMRSNYESSTFKGGTACLIGLWRWSTMYEDVQHTMDQRLSFPIKRRPPETSLYESLKHQVQLLSTMQRVFSTMRRQDADLDSSVSNRYAQAHLTSFHMQFMLLQSMFTSALENAAGQAMCADSFYALMATLPGADHPMSNDP